MKTIPLSGRTGQGKFAIVDDGMYEQLRRWRWHCAGNGYAARWDPQTRKIVMMHREIMNAPKGMSVDYIDGQTLRNERINLRICTNTENARNARIPKNNTSGHKGVTWCKITNQWMAQIMVDRRCIRLGCFDDKTQAACAHNAAALRYFGQFARLNDVPGTPEMWKAILEEALSTITRKPNTSGFVGVSWSEERKKWESYITFDHHRIALGRYDSRELAAYIRDQAALQLYGQTAKLNILDKDQTTL